MDVIKTKGKRAICEKVRIGHFSFGVWSWLILAIFAWGGGGGVGRFGNFWGEGWVNVGG